MRAINQQVSVPTEAVNPPGIGAFARSSDKKRKVIRNNHGQSKLSEPCWRRICATLLLPLLLLAWPVVLQAQFSYLTDNGTITITGYTGPGDEVFIPDTINGLPVTRIGYYAFFYCTRLTSVHFRGDAPPGLVSSGVFNGTPDARVYYLPGTGGWGTPFGSRPTALWVLPNPLILSFGPTFGVGTSGFGFIISWATNLPVVVEACTNLANPNWSPLATNTLTGGWSCFSDPQWTNHPNRFYRIRSP